MSLDALVATATSCTGILSIQSEESFSMLSGTCVIECESTTLTIGSAVTATIMGTTVFSGRVKKLERLFPEMFVRVSCNDILVQAVDYFMVSDDPEAPFQRNNISSLNLVKDLLAEAGITNVTSTEPTPTFVWGTNEDGARFNLQSVADSISFIAAITGNTIYFDRAANRVEFIRRVPYVEAGDVSSGSWITGTSGSLLEIQYSESSDRTRNVVKIYGRSPLTATRSASNAYLVVDQAIAIAHELL